MTKGSKHTEGMSAPVKKGADSKDVQNKHNIFSKFVYHLEKVEVDNTKYVPKSRVDKSHISKKQTMQKSDEKGRMEKSINLLRRHQDKPENDKGKSREKPKSEKYCGDKHFKENYDTTEKHYKLPVIKIKRNHKKIDLTQNEKRPMISRIATAIDMRHRKKVEPKQVEERPMMSRFVKAIEFKLHHDKIEPKQVEERPMRSRIIRAMEIKRHHDKSEENIKQVPERPMIYRIVNRAMDIKPSFIFHEKMERESNRSQEKLNIPSKNSLEFHLSSKIWQVLSHDLFNSNDENVDNNIKATDSEMKSHILSVIKKYNKKELKHNGPEGQTQTVENPSTSSTSRKRLLKQAVKRQLWHWAKNAIRSNERWRKLFAENHIMLDNINIDKLDLSLIDIDALGIDNKMVKQTIIWLFK